MMVRIARASTIATTLIAVVIGFCAPISAQQYGTAERRLRLRERAQRREATRTSPRRSWRTRSRTACRIPRACSRARSARSARPRPSAPPTSSQRIVKLKEAVAAYESYLKKFPSGEKAAIARLKLSEWLRTAGEICAAQIKKESTPEKKEALKADGLNFFTKAEVLAKARVEELARTPKDQDDGGPAGGALRAQVRGRPHAVFEGAALREPHRSRSRAAAQRGAEPPRGARPRSAAGLDPHVRDAAHHRAHPGRAEQARRTPRTRSSTPATQLAEAATSDPTIVKEHPDNEETRELFARMFLEKVDFLTKTKKPPDWKGALDYDREAPEADPGHRQDEGREAGVDHPGRGLQAGRRHQEGQHDRAAGLRRTTRAATPGSRRARCSTSSGSRAAPTRRRWSSSSQGCVERGDIPQGEKMAARILTSAEVKAKPEIQADTLLQLGGLYFNKGLYSYAAVVFAAVSDEFAGSPRAPEAKFNEAMSYAKQAQLDGRAGREVLEGQEQGGPQRSDRPVRRLEGGRRRELVRGRGAQARREVRGGPRPLPEGPLDVEPLRRRPIRGGLHRVQPRRAGPAAQQAGRGRQELPEGRGRLQGRRHVARDLDQEHDQPFRARVA